MIVARNKTGLSSYQIRPMDRSRGAYLSYFYLHKEVDSQYMEHSPPEGHGLLTAWFLSPRHYHLDL
jgi:hypothetical protein